MPRVVAVATGILLGLPGSASAHGVIRSFGGELSYVSEDAGSPSRLEIAATLAEITVYDPGTIGGIQAPASCRPGRTDDRGQVARADAPGEAQPAERATPAALGDRGGHRRRGQHLPPARLRIRLRR